MSEKVNLDEVRANALASVDRSERNFKLAFLCAVMVEVLFFVAFLLLADFSNRVHLLLLISTVSGYSIVVFGLIALGAHMNRCVLRVLKALELLKG